MRARPLHPISRRIRRTIVRHRLAENGDRIAVAVSGGSDSVAMVRVLAELAQAGAPYTLAGLVHVNHGLRGAESAEDEAFCRNLAASLGLPVDVRSVDVTAHARHARVSIEAAARALRYEAFDAAMGALGATLVATGHTADDQAETVLLRLLRGAATRGVSAIRPRRGRVIRPLLDCRREDLRLFLADRAQPFREDASNLDTAFARNRVRHDLLPRMTETWPGVVGALARFAELAEADEAFLTRTAMEVMPAVTLPTIDGVQRIDIRGLNQLPPPLARRIVRRAIESAGGTPSFREIEAVRALARADKKKDAHLDLAGSEVAREGHALMFLAPRPTNRRPLAFEYLLPVPGIVTIAETGTSIQASLITGALERPAAADALHSVAFQADRAAGPLTVRNRRPGDRFRPLGGPGSRKLQDVLVDRKIPRQERDRLPLVVDARGRILWVVGVAMAEDARVLRPESGMVVLESVNQLGMKKETQ